MKPVPLTQSKIENWSIPEPNTGCWLWLGFVDNYGCVRDGKKNIGAHVGSYRVFKGEIPEGFEINHICNQKSCVNPDHLEAVTHKRNIEYRNACGKQGKSHSQLAGERHPNAKLTEESVQYIRESKRSSNLLATELNVSPSLIRTVRRKEIWKHA